MKIHDALAPGLQLTLPQELLDLGESVVEFQATGVEKRARWLDPLAGYDLLHLSQ